MLPPHLPIFVIHWVGLPQRKRRLAAMLDREGFAPEQIVWIEQFDRATLTDAQRDQAVVFSQAEYVRRVRHTPPSDRPRWQRLSDGEMCCALSHREAWRLAAEESCEFSLVLEDDAVLDDGFRQRLDEVGAQLPHGVDLCYLGRGCPKHVLEGEPGRLVHPEPQGRSRTSESYLISRRAARAMADALLPMCLPIDHEQTHLANRLGLAVYWAEPPLTRQGSKYGLYASCLR